MNAPWRTGRKLGRTLYQRTYTDGPSDDDKFLGIVDTSELAQHVVAAVNAVALIRELHKPVTDGHIRAKKVCEHCRTEGAWGYSESVEWPCPTIRALEGQ